MHLRAITLTMCGAALLSPPAAGQSSRYSDGWQPPQKMAERAKPATPPMHLLLRELDRMTSEAERAKAAHPRLLSDMRALARRYARRWPRIVLRDPFLDRNLTANPHWTVEAGAYRIGRHGLVIGGRTDRASGYATPPAPEPAPQQPQDDAQPRFGDDLLGSLLEGLTRDRDSDGTTPAENAAQEPESPEPPAPASAGGGLRLRTQLAIPNAFALRVALRSRAGAGSAFEMGVVQGAGDSGYRLIYRPAGSPALSLVRVGRRGSKTLGSVFEPIRLDDRKRHTLVLARDILGEVSAAIDGKLLVRRRDNGFRDDFDSVLLNVTGGTYVVRGVVVVGSP